MTRADRTIRRSHPRYAARHCVAEKTHTGALARVRNALHTRSPGSFAGCGGVRLPEMADAMDVCQGTDDACCR